jgi:hypothetical protein
MRTKTLVLTALGSLSALGLMAQTSTNVYSLNAVGYINVTLPPGFSIVADQLIATGGNTISNLVNDTSGAYDGLTYFKFTGHGFNYDTASSTFGAGNNGWPSGGQDTLNPGEAAWFQNPNTTNMTLTFVGTVPQGTNTVSLPVGFSLISSPVPQAGTLSTALGFTNVNQNDVVFVWQPNGTGGGSYVDGGDQVVPAGFGSGYNTEWSPNEPTVAVGQGFWYQATAAVNWTRVFSVNQ